MTGTPRRRRTWIWLEAGISVIVGSVLVWRGSAVGWIFILLGIVYLALLTPLGRRR